MINAREQHAYSTHTGHCLSQHYMQLGDMVSSQTLNYMLTMNESQNSKSLVVLLLGMADGVTETKELADIATVTALPDEIDPTHLSDDICSHVVALVAAVQCEINQAFLNRCPKLRIIVRFGMGVDNIDVEYAGKLGIVVCNVPNYGTDEVANTALSHILALFRQTLVFNNSVSNGVEYRTFKDIIAGSSTSRRIRGKTLGIIGLGRIGNAVAQRAKAFGFNIAFYDPFIASEWDEAFDRVESLTDLVKISDCVSLHCMLTEENRYLVNESLLKVFKPEAFLINVSRGPLVDEAALARALKEGWISGAALDVHEEEPFSFERSPLKDAPNLICTPHIVWYSKEAFDDLRSTSIELVRCVLTGSDLTSIQNCVNIYNT